nr:hypothetical protein CFP56_10655 [Quercus suber]
MLAAKETFVDSTTTVDPSGGADYADPTVTHPLSLRTNQLSLHSSNLRQPPHLSRRRPITATVSLSLPTAKPEKASSSIVKIPKVIERKSLFSLRPISSQSQKYLLVFFRNQSALCIWLHRNCLSVFFGCELGCSTIQHDIAALFLWASCFLRGSFGHFQASKSGVHKGGLDQSLVKVTTLNLEVVRALAKDCKKKRHYKFV